jgi:Sulfocyanin (SoxE) domain
MPKVLYRMRFGLLLAARTVFSVPSLAAQDAALPTWIHPDSAGKAVLLELAVTRPADAASAQLSAEHDGSIQVIVPRGWTVRWHWINQDSTASHSLVVVAEREKLPQQGGQAVFTNAMTRSVLLGLPAGRTDDTSFEAEEGGWFWVICGVPGHAIAGEWISLRIDPAATEVGVKRK